MTTSAPMTSALTIWKRDTSDDEVYNEYDDECDKCSDEYVERWRSTTSAMKIVKGGAEYVGDEYSDEYYDRRSTTSGQLWRATPMSATSGLTWWMTRGMMTCKICSEYWCSVFNEVSIIKCVAFHQKMDRSSISINNSVRSRERRET